LERSQEQLVEISGNIQLESVQEEPPPQPRPASWRHSAPDTPTEGLESQMLQHMRQELIREPDGSSRRIALAKWIRRAEIHQAELRHELQLEHDTEAVPSPAPLRKSARSRKSSDDSPDADNNRGSHRMELLVSVFRTKITRLKKLVKPHA